MPLYNSSHSSEEHAAFFAETWFQLQQNERPHTHGGQHLAEAFQSYGPITIAIRARFEYDSSTIQLQHGTTRYEVFRALA